MHFLKEEHLTGDERWRRLRSLEPFIGVGFSGLGV